MRRLTLTLVVLGLASCGGDDGLSESDALRAAAEASCKQQFRCLGDATKPYPSIAACAEATKADPYDNGKPCNTNETFDSSQGAKCVAALEKKACDVSTGPAECRNVCVPNK